MILYSCRTNKLPTKPDFDYNITNQFKMFNYDFDMFQNHRYKTSQQRITEDVYYTYTTLVSFNNSLDKDITSSFEILDKYLTSHTEVTDSDDRRCREYYEKMGRWYKRYISNPSENVYKEICDEIQTLMKYLKKIGIVKESGCNLKKNYY